MVVKAKKGFINMDDVDDVQIKKVMGDAPLIDKVKSKAGRKKKSEEDKATKTMVVYFTEEQKETVENYCNGKDIPFSVLVRQLLNERGIL